MKYRLRPETQHLTINIIDRYLSRTQVPRKKLQLVGVAAMFIAAKFEEIDPPELHDWVYITDKAYTKDDVLLMVHNAYRAWIPGCGAHNRTLLQFLGEGKWLRCNTAKHG